LQRVAVIAVRCGLVAVIAVRCSVLQSLRYT